MEIDHGNYCKYQRETPRKKFSGCPSVRSVVIRRSIAETPGTRGAKGLCVYARDVRRA